MKKVTLANNIEGRAVIVSDAFIEEHMISANGEYVKVYLLLLKYMNEGDLSVIVSKIADVLERTEKYVNRAVNYWSEMGLISICDNEEVVSEEEKAKSKSDENEKNIKIKSEAPKKSVKAELTIEEKIMSKEINSEVIEERKEVATLIFVAEQYLGPMSAGWVKLIYYLYDDLKMSAELIEYLIEDAVENGKTKSGINYVAKVAEDWEKKGIDTVEKAKEDRFSYQAKNMPVLKSLGLFGKEFTPAQRKEFDKNMNRWTSVYGFSGDMIVEACNRTMIKINEPSYKYVDGILKNWKAEGIADFKELEAADKKREAANQSKKVADKSVSKIYGAGGQILAKGTLINRNFEQRDYGDMEELARKLDGF